MLAIIAATFLFDVPLGPGLEGRAEELVAPYEHMQEIEDTGWELRHLRVGAREITYVISRAGAKPEALVVLKLDSVNEGDLDASVEVGPASESGGAEEAALRAGASLERVLRARLKAGEIEVRHRGPPPQRQGGDTPSSPETPGSTVQAPTAQAPPARAPDEPPGGMPGWLSRVLLWSLLAALLVALPSALRLTWPSSWLRLVAPAAVLLVIAVALFALDDMVLHANGHGWDTVRVVSGPDNAPFYRPFGLYNRYGPLHVDLPSMLGAGASAGHETFLASRLSALLLCALLWAVALLLFRCERRALMALGFLATSPVFLAVGRAETVTATGMALMMLTLWLSILAGRHRSYRLLVAAGLALTCLASFRLMGPLLAPFAGVALLGRPCPEAEDVRHWRLKAAGVLLLAIAISSPHLIQMGVMMTADMSVRAGTNVVPPSILDSALWVPSALVWAALLGGALLALEHRWVGLLLWGWAAVALLAPSSSAAFYQDHARYQAWLIPSAALMAGWAADAVGRRLWLLGPPLLVAYVLWMCQGSWLPGQALAHPTAEQAQLTALRMIAHELPANAVVAVPSRTRSRARTSLPDVEMAALRPDVEWVPLKVAMQRSSDLRDRPHYWLESLPCSARYPGENAAMMVDCTLASERLTLSPIYTWRVEPELPPELAEAMSGLSTDLQPTRGDTTQWNPRPFWRDPFVRLHRITGWGASQGAPDGGRPGPTPPRGPGP